MLNFFLLSAIKLNEFMLNVVMLSAIILNVIMISIIMLSKAILSVMLNFTHAECHYAKGCLCRMSSWYKFL
jgi:hypothetical protein